MELSETNAADYLKSAGRVSPDAPILVKSLSGGIANIVLQAFDAQSGRCLVLKQPLGKFRSAAEWLVDVERVEVERDCIELLTTLLPAGSVPGFLWYDVENRILAISCAPVGAVIWKKALLSGEASVEAATHAGMLLAILHSSTQNDPQVQARYGDPKLFSQQRIDPYFYATGARHPDLDAQLRKNRRHAAGSADVPDPRGFFAEKYLPHPAEIQPPRNAGRKATQPGGRSSHAAGF